MTKELDLFNVIQSSRQLETAGLLVNSARLDYFEPHTLSYDCNIASKDNSLLVFQDSGGKDVVQNDIFSHDEIPLKKKLQLVVRFRGEGKVSSSVVGYVPDALDFRKW